MPNKVQFTPYLVSFYPNIDMHYLKQEENNKTWYCTQEDIPKDKKSFIQPNKNRDIKSSVTSASLIFYDEKKNRLFSKFASGSYQHEFPYGFIWDIDGNSFDKCIFSPTDAYTGSIFFSEKNNNYYNENSITVVNGEQQDYHKRYFGKKNILDFAKYKIIDRAKELYDILQDNSKEICLASNHKKRAEVLTNITQAQSDLDKYNLNDGLKNYKWITPDDKYCLIENKPPYQQANICFLLNTPIIGYDEDNIPIKGDIEPKLWQMKINNDYNEIAIKNDNNRMYFKHLCVDIECMTNALTSEKEYIKKDRKENIANFQSFINACLMTGGEDIVIFRNKKEEELANNDNDKFWLKSSPLIKEKITFLKFIDEYCKDFQQYFTDEQKQQIEELRNKKDINNVSLFGLGCYQMTEEEKNNNPCGCLFW